MPLPESTSDCITYTYTEDGKLTIQHINTAFNCCTEYDATITVYGIRITIVEDETAGNCNCNCLYDLTFEVPSLPRGTYRIVVSQEFLIGADDPHVFEVDLTQPTSGESCITRTHYPWGDG